MKREGERGGGREGKKTKLLAVHLNDVEFRWGSRGPELMVCEPAHQLVHISLVGWAVVWGRLPFHLPICQWQAINTAAKSFKVPLRKSPDCP